MTGYRLVAAMCLAHAVSMLGFASFPALQPQFIAVWSLSNTDAGWINAIFFLAYMLAVPPLVSLTDRVDPRYIYGLCAVLGTLAALGFALLAEGFWIALLFRALAGVAVGGTYMPGLKLLTDHLSGPAQPRAVAFYTATFGIGAALSVFLAGEVAALLGWRWAVGLAAAGPLLALVMALLLLPPSQDHHLSRPTTALLDFRPVLRNRRAMAYVLAYTAHNWELFALRSWLVTYLVYSQAHQAPGALGLAWSATGIAALSNLIGTVASILGNEAAQRIGRRPYLFLAMGLSAAIAALLGFAVELPFVVVVLLCLIYSMTVTADSAAITSGAVATALPGQRGATMAVHSFIGFGGSFLGPLLFGVVLDLTGGGQDSLSWGFAFLSAALAVACGPLALALLDRSEESQA